MTASSFPSVSITRPSALRVREIVLLCRPAEARLLGRCRGIDRVATDPGDLSPAAAQATVLGLAAALGVTPETMRGGEPYLSPDSETTGRWRGSVGAARGGFRVGVCWQGHPRHAADARRSFRLEHLAPLAAVPSVALVSLQKGPGCEQLAASGFPVVDLGFEYQVGDWLHTAAIISQLDLVISPDSSVAHSRRPGAADMDRAIPLRRAALAARPGRLTLVFERPPVPAGDARGLGWRLPADGRRPRRVSGRSAVRPRRLAGAGSPRGRDRVG